MMNDNIIKGKGVYKRGAGGKLIPMSFPHPSSPHKEMSHFHIDHSTGNRTKRYPITCVIGLWRRRQGILEKIES